MKQLPYPFILEYSSSLIYGRNIILPGLSEITVAKIEHPLAENRSAVAIRKRPSIRGYWQTGIPTEITRLACKLSLRRLGQFPVTNRNCMDMNGGVCV